MKKSFRARRYITAAVLLATLFLSPASRPAPAPTPAPQATLTSILIVAQDAVSDPNFGGSIVVVMNNLGPAPVGLIINRPMPLTVARFFPKLKSLAHVQDRMYFGGPVEFDTVWYLFQAKTAPAVALRVCDGVYISSDDKLLLKLLARKDPMQGLRIFIGHAGWAPGQLQAEIEGGAWTPKRADVDSIFNPRPQLPWPSHGQKPGT